MEDATNPGRIDMAVHTNRYIWLFEFKTTRHTPTNADHTASDAALRQMQDRGYADKHGIHGLPIILVSIKFDIETRNIADYRTATT